MKNRQILGPCQRTKKTVEHECDDDTNCNWCSWYGPKKLGRKIWGSGNQRKNQDHPNYRIIKIGQNTGKSPDNLRRLAVTQTPLKDYLLMLVWKNIIQKYKIQINNFKKIMIIIIFPILISFQVFQSKTNNFPHSYIVSSIPIQN